MAVQVSYPGVYIEEFAPGAPIQGVGTSIAAFIGPAAKGELDEPTKITSWDRFLEMFGERPLPGFFLWYAVRGFFENGGQVCYIVRTSNGTYGEVILNNVGGDPFLRVRARHPGNAVIDVEVIDAHLLAAADLYRPVANFTTTPVGREIIVNGANAPQAIANAAQFRPGDYLDISSESEPLRLIRVTGNTLLLEKELSNPQNSGTIRLADTDSKTRTVRIRPANAANPLPSGTLVPGTLLTIADGTVSESQIVDSVQSEQLQTSPPITTYRVTFRQNLSASFSLAPLNTATVQSEEFDIRITQNGVGPTYPNLSIDLAHPHYFLDTVNRKDELVKLDLVEPPPATTPPDNLPAATTASVPAGTPENLSTLGDADFVEALDTLREIDDVNLIAIPDRTNAAVQGPLIDHCQLMADRFAVLDAQPGLGLFGNNSVETQRQGLDSTRGYAALYYPWLRVRPVGPGAPILVPPSGHVCGIMARSDNIRGVHKAPANEIVNGALGVERTMSDIDQGQLNLTGINVIRIFQTGGRPVLWGARTTATDRNWQYVNIRRLFLFLEESIEEGIRWAVFEPNNLQLWQKLKRTITEFLTRVWRDGALFGETPEDAFYVRIDKVLNPFSEQALGRLNIEIGVRPSYPAEFIIVRIGIFQGGSEVTEI